MDRHQLPCQHQQVVELECAVFGAGVCIGQHPPSEQRTQHTDAVVADRLQERLGAIGQIDLSFAKRRQSGGIESCGLPFRLRPGVLDLSASIFEVNEQGDLLTEPVRRAQRHGAVTKLVESCRLGVVGGTRGTTHGEHIGCEGPRVEAPGRRIGAIDASFDEIPVVVEAGCHPSATREQAEVVEPAQLDQCAPTLDDATGWLGVVEDLVEQNAPSFLEREVALELVEHAEARGEPGLYREVVEDASSEGVQGPDRCVVERIERCMHTFCPCRIGGACGSFRRRERGAQPVAKLGGRFLGERDGGDCSDLDAARDQRDDAFDEAARLARAGTGFDEEVDVEISDDGVAITLIGEGSVDGHD